jgi:hypothetical protein
MLSSEIDLSGPGKLNTSSFSGVTVIVIGSGIWYDLWWIAFETASSTAAYG